MSLFGAIWLILQPKKVQALKKQFFEAFFFAHRAKNLAISGFFVNKTSILSTNSHYFSECVEWLMIHKYRSNNSLSEKEKTLLISDDSVIEYILEIACTKYEKYFAMKFPKATQNEIYQLSWLKVYDEFVSEMTLDDLMLALFRGAPAKEYFNRIKKYMKNDNMDNDAFNPCALIPDTIDPRGYEP